MKIPDSYKKDIPLVLYGAGVTAGFVYESFLEQGINVVCFADGDKKKQGKPPYRGSNLITRSIDEVKALYPQFQIYVTTFSIVKFSIFDFLVNKANVDKHYILNYEPYVKRYSCKHLENCLICWHDKVGYCTTQRDGIKIPMLYYNEAESAEKDEIIKVVNKLFTLKNKTIARLQNKTAKFCTGCSFLSDIYVPENKFYINILIFGSCVKSMCNLECCYCSINKPKNIPTIPKYPFKFAKYLEDNELISPETTTIYFGDGELTILPNKKELFSLISRYNSQISTNAVVYSEEIAELMAAHKTRISVSLDAGTEETFHKIKGKNLFAKVKDTLVKYSKTNGNIILKYIFIPGLNDSQKDLDGFLDICKEVSVEQIRLSFDFRLDYSLLRSTGLFKKVLSYTEKLRQEGFLVDAYEMSVFKKSDFDAIMGNTL